MANAKVLLVDDDNTIRYSLSMILEQHGFKVSSAAKQIADTGGGLTLDASTLTFNQLRDITTAASSGKAKITVKNLTSLTSLQLGELSALAPGLIVFDLTS
ncbi:hypothetical protein RBB79_18215 [Tunturiibacter empetritectus]|uniref:CheY-like chemotaxis protein n=2 Tax=Tunturiibacter TaxID=3154218 RepID=A0A852VNF6_9BACT|nr:hypothetical protein [Edaphobacter lichenicola]NYF91595.1 CheY-like chemotaxis protein [Edaphobacter lichenicola]